MREKSDTGRGRYYKNGKFLLQGFITVNYGILQILRTFITDITRLCIKDMLTLDQDPEKKLPKRSYLKKTKNLLKILRNITDITEFAITEYYRILHMPPALAISLREREREREKERERNIIKYSV